MASGILRVALAAPILLAALSASTAHAAEYDLNRALGKPVQQSTEGFGGAAARAVDGNTNGNFFGNSVTHTLQEYQPYWQVDLGGVYDIDTIELFNRTDCCRERLHDFFVFYSPDPFANRGASETFQQQNVQGRTVFGQAQDHHVIQLGKKVRYLRIQLADTGYLSLAEVKVNQHVKVDGPAAIANQISWVPTGVFTDASAFALASFDEKVHAFQRGFDGRLHTAPDVTSDRAIPGSPLLAAGAPSVALDPASNQVFVAVQGADGNLWLATGAAPAAAGADRTWSWETIAPTEAEPSVVVAQGKVVVAWLQGSHIRSTWKAAVGGSWATPTIHIDAVTPPTLAVNSKGAVGIAFLRWENSINFVKGVVDTSVSWSPVEVITGTSNAGRVGLGAWGEMFMISALGINDARPYLAIQQYINGAPRWNGFEPAWGAVDVPLMEAPRVLVFSGMVFILGRDRNQALRYWMRNPNSIRPAAPAAQQWLGGRVVSGWGTGATPPAFASVGHSTVWGVWGSPSEQYVATRGGGDRQLYAMNFGRFVALDLLQNVFGLRLSGNASVPELEVKTANNLFEHLVAFLSLPSAAWATAARSPSCSAATAGVQILLHPDTAGQTRGSQCPPVMYLNSSYQWAFFMFHEWMHMDSARRGYTGWGGFSATFGGSNNTPKLCGSDADCGGETCRLADEEFGWFDDPPIRRWIGFKVCVAGDRPQGHSTYYGLQGEEHDFIETAQRYRWSGAWLRREALRDLNHGNARLWNAYQWMKNNYFGGVEYNGDDAAATDRNLGEFGMPIP